MDLSSTLQSRASTTKPSAYFPPHPTQLPPRLQINTFSSSPSQNKLQTSSSSNNNNKCLIFSIALLTIPFLFYLFSTAQKIHYSSKFSQPKSQFFSIIIDSGSSGSRVRVYQFLSEGVVPFGNGQMPLVVGSFKVRRQLAEDPENASPLIGDLVEFAKGRVSKKEWRNSKVQLLINGGEMEKLELRVKEVVLESCRRALRESGFMFKDEWARDVEGEERGVYAWVAANYALGNLGGDPRKTTGIAELGANSLKVTFTSRNVIKRNSIRVIKLAGMTYNLQIQNFPRFSQDAAWESVQGFHDSTQLTSASTNRASPFGNPCIPKGYEMASNITEVKPLLSHSGGNFTACRLEALSLLKSQEEKCLHPPCSIVSSLFLDPSGETVSQESLFYTSEFFGMFPRSNLFQLEAAGKHFCEGDWNELKSQHRGIDGMDLVNYCFTSAYMVALLHDSLGIPMNDQRIGLASHTESYPYDWTVGAFILQSILQPLDMETDMEQIVGNELVTYFSLVSFLLIFMLAVLFLLQWRKPQLKTIYDLEKGHYIVTKVAR